jgi:dipeptidyl aminopeptidase/acylaminoacyl peptidase
MIGSLGDGSLIEALPDYEGEVRDLEWQDASTIMFLGDEGVWSTFGEVGLDSQNRKTHVPAGKAVLSGFSLSADGHSAAMLRESPTYPTEVFYMAHGDSGPRRLTDSNPWLKDFQLAKQEPISFTARDGLSLEGILIRPLEEKLEERHPLILAVHGGPEAHDRNGWLTGPGAPGQVAAARGFAVFHPNYRGSTGRGVEFSKLGQNDFAGKEFDDLVDAVDHLINMGLVDRNRVGITGGSYGGFAAAWCATYYSDRFAAAVMNVGVSNNLSMAGTTDIPEEMFHVHARARVWDDWEKFLERSPIFHVRKCRTPTLIMHGKDDPRVPRTQSLEFYRHLKTLGQAPVRLVMYPGEGHGNRRAASRLDYHLRMLQWFEHYLKGPSGEPPPVDVEYPFESKQETRSDDSGNEK